MLESGYIKLYRSLLSWEWYDDINTKTVFLHLLLTVSIEESKWHGITGCQVIRHLPKKQDCQCNSYAHR